MKPILKDLIEHERQLRALSRRKKRILEKIYLNTSQSFNAQPSLMMIHWTINDTFCT